MKNIKSGFEQSLEGEQVFPPPLWKAKPTSGMGEDNGGSPSSEKSHTDKGAPTLDADSPLV